MEKEICICAAVKYSDKIFRGHRHGNCIAVAHDVLSFNHTRKEIMGMDKTQGFITSKNRFVNRSEGYRLQIEAGIESVNPGGYNHAGEELYSEDLY